MASLRLDMVFKVILGFYFWISTCSAQIQSDTTYTYNTHQLIGVQVGVGAASAPLGWWGFSLFYRRKYVEYQLSSAQSNVNRYSLGMNIYGDATRKWTWHTSFNFVHSRQKYFTYDPDAATRREYRVSDAQFVHCGVGTLFHVRGYQKRDCRHLVFTVGYQWRVSDFTVVPVGMSDFKQLEIDKMAHDLFKSRWFWSVAFRFGEFWPKRSKSV
jgi:hypothetical protein